MIRNPFEIVSWFEEEIAAYTGSKYAIAVNSCTNAIFLSFKYAFEYQLPKWRKILNMDDGSPPRPVIIPKQTYLSVPQSIVQAGGKVIYEDVEWQGIYQFQPYPIYDAAKRLTSNMYIRNTLMCLSFHHKKLLPIGKGGMILCDDEEAVKQIKKMRYEGRSDGVPYHEDLIDDMGYNMYMTPEQAARGLTLLSCYPEHMPDQIEDPPYRDLTTFLRMNN
jgi:dTDP-4-amino-4,6-dideoxygalactose transaminase